LIKYVKNKDHIFTIISSNQLDQFIIVNSKLLTGSLYNYFNIIERKDSTESQILNYNEFQFFFFSRVVFLFIHKQV